MKNKIIPGTDVECACGAWGTAYCDCSGLRWRWRQELPDGGLYFSAWFDMSEYWSLGE